MMRTTTNMTANVKDTKYKAMTDKMIAMEKMMEKLMVQMGAKPTDTTQGDKKSHPFKYKWNMGSYCYGCVFHPGGTNHSSTTCTCKKAGHVEMTTWANQGPNRSMAWPIMTKVKKSQQDHASYKNKSAPTNCQGPGITDSNNHISM